MVVCVCRIFLGLYLSVVFLVGVIRVCVIIVFGVVKLEVLFFKGLIVIIWWVGSRGLVLIRVEEED